MLEKIHICIGLHIIKICHYKKKIDSRYLKKKNNNKTYILANFHFKYNPWLYVLYISVSVQRNPWVSIQSLRPHPPGLNHYIDYKTGLLCLLCPHGNNGMKRCENIQEKSSAAYPKIYRWWNLTLVSPWAHH